MQSKQKRYEELCQSHDKGTSYTYELALKFLHDYPEHPGAMISLGVSLIEMARYNEAMRIFKKLISIVPPEKLHGCYVQLGHLNNEKGNLSKAVEYYEKAITVFSNQGYYFIYLGGALAKQGKFDEALKAHRKALRYKNVDKDEAYLNIGLILRAKGKYNEAARYFKKAISIDSNYVEAKVALADVESAMKVKTQPITPPYHNRATASRGCKV
jgi:tetratricopeptide (TPR) repeat protein